MKQFYTLFIMLLLLLSIVVVTVRAGEQELTQNQGSETHKVVAESGALDPNAPGVTLLADYGTYQLFSVTNMQLNRLSSMPADQSYIADDMDVIEINGHVLDTQWDDALTSQLALSSVSTGNSLQLIQFVGPVKDEWLAAVQAAGNEPIHYIANNGYLVWADENGRSQLNTMLNQGTTLQFNATLPPPLKLSPELVDMMDDGEETAVIPIVVQMVQHPGKALNEAVIEKLLITQSGAWQPVLKFQTIYGTARQNDIAAISELSDVYWLGVQQSFELLDEVQGQIVAGNIITKTPYSAIPSGPGYLTWLDSYGFSKNPADYPIVDITDDGIGNGAVNLAAGDETLREMGLVTTNSRLAYINNCTSAANGSSVGGHGHLNVSIAGGYDTRSGFPYRDDNGYQLGLGINPYGRFGGTRVFFFDYLAFPSGKTTWNLSGCEGTYEGLIKKNQDSGAKISNNSWGCTDSDCLNSYNETAQAYDVGVRDADLTESGNQELTYIFSAGNEGRAKSIGTPATAKNVITVGATESYRPYGIDGCKLGPSSADDVMDIASFSSQGPAAGERIKPELVAPGTHVQATASPDLFFNGDTVCGAENNNGEFPADDVYFPEKQSVFTWSSGTSHSAPAVAGIASLYYYWLENKHNLDAPSPAMIKAYLLTHTRYVTGAGANDTLPSNRQGYGLPDMSVGLDETPRVILDQRVIFGKSGDLWQQNVMVADPAKPVRIVMAYTDAAGAVGTSPQVNDLNLQIETSDNLYLGNHFQWSWSIPGGTPDSKNNYEAIFLPPSETEGFMMRVMALNIAGDGVPNNADQTDQDFALICYNCVEVLEITPESQSACMSADSGRVVYEVTAVTQPGIKEEITYNVAGLPPTTTANFNPNPQTLPGKSTLMVSNLDTSVPGKYLIEVNGVSDSSIRKTKVRLELYQEPAISVLLSPKNGASGQTSSVNLLWQEAEQGKTYTVEVATDSAFTNIVASATGLTQTNYLVDSLVGGSSYYWRVSASNDCGAGDFSNAFRFSVRSNVYLPIIVAD